MPARSTFSDKHRAFLESKKAEFAAAVENKHISETLAVIFRQFFKRFPIDLDDDQEPSDEMLAGVDDSAADPDIEEPSESLGPDEYAAAVDASKARQLRIQAKRAVSCAMFGLEGIADAGFAANHKVVWVPLRQGPRCQSSRQRPQKPI